jgi:AcrR family transcriptional regulator
MPPEQRREQLLDAALSVILEQGYSGVSIEAVARIAGVTRPVVYDHFPNLGRLLAALVEREERYALSELEHVVPDEPGGQNPSELLTHGVRSFLDAVTRRPATWRIILLPLDGTPAIIRDQVEMNQARTDERIARLVRWAAVELGLPSDLDVELAARTIRHLGEEAGRMVLTQPERYPPERYERFVAMAMGSLWPPHGPGR